MISLANLKLYQTNLEVLKDKTGDLNSLFKELQLGVGGVEVESATGAIGIKMGTAVITKSSAPAVMTLALPTATTDDGKILRIYAIGAQAHTVTTPAHGINANKNVTTFGGALGDCIVLLAYQAVWYVVSTVNQTLSGS